MNYPKQLLAYFFTYFILNVGYSQISVLSIKSEKINSDDNGFFYSLPQTVIKVDVDVAKIESIKGPYSDYAKKMLGLDEIIVNNNTFYNIEDIKISALSEVDPEQYYFVKTDDLSKKEKKIIFSLSEYGYIKGMTSLNNDDDNELKAYFSGNYNDTKLFKELLKPTIIESVDTIIKRINIDTISVTKKILRQRISEKTTEQQAREVADMIKRIDNNRFNLLTGYQEVNYSKESIELMINQMNKLEKEYLELFAGITNKTKEKYTYYIVPESGSADGIESIFKFSKNEGILAKISEYGETVSVVYHSENVNKPIFDIVKRRNESFKKKRGFYYRIPEKVKVSIQISGKSIVERYMPINQMGLTTFLPVNNISDFKIYSNSGALQNVIIK